MTDADLNRLREELARCEKELDDAKELARDSHVRLQAILIRFKRARTALDLATSQETR